MSALYIARLAALGATLLFAIVVLGVSANLTNLSLEGLGATFTFEALAVATSVITVVSLPVLLIVGALRTGAFTSMIVVELSWLAVLWILWLSTGALTANDSSLLFPNGCDFFNSEAQSICHQFFAIEGIAFLNWLILMIYSAVLVAFASVGNARGNRTWTASVRDARFLARADGADGEKHGAPGAGVAALPASAPAQYPPAGAGSVQVGSVQAGAVASPAPGAYAGQAQGAAYQV